MVFFFHLKVAHVLSVLLLFAAMFGVQQALYIGNPDVHSYKHAGMIKVNHSDWHKTKVYLRIFIIFRVHTYLDALEQEPDLMPSESHLSRRIHKINRRLGINLCNNVQNCQNVIRCVL